MRTSLLADMTAPYGAAESWIYDRVVAPAVAHLGDSVMRQWLPELRGEAQVLDVGCGGGQLALQLAQEVKDARVTGLDLSAEQVSRAKQRARSRGLERRVDFVRGSALDQPFEDGSFDAVFSVASIKHWPDQAGGLAECVRVLRPGGTLLIVEADRGCHLSDAVRFVRGWSLPSALRPLALATFRTWVAGQALDLDEARCLARGLNLDEVRVERVPDLPALVITGSRR